jgi:hypothetical protein
MLLFYNNFQINMKHLILVFTILTLVAFIPQQDPRTAFFPKVIERVEKIPNKNKVWVFVLAGQSNMAGRGLVEAQDTLADKRILTINAGGQLVYAKEPLHFYEPTMAGFDCGLSFGKTLLKTIPRDISVLIIPTAIGGSSIKQWLGDSVYRGVKLLTNFKEKVLLAKKYGDIKAVLWHQGESDANKASIPEYENRLSKLFTIFRSTIQNDQLPIVVGELGSYSNAKEDWSSINNAIHHYSKTDLHVSVVKSGDLEQKGDHIHFNSEGQRKLGERYALAYLQLLKK